MLKIGIIGKESTAEKINELASNFQVVGFFDPLEFNESLFGDISSAFTPFLNKVDAVYFSNAKESYSTTLMDKSIRYSKHVLVSGFLPSGINTMEKMSKLNQEAGVTIQFSNILRQNPTVVCATQYLKNVRFIRSTRKVPRNNLSLKSIITDYLQHEINLVSYLFNSEVKKITPNVLQVFEDSPEIVSLHIEFNNECIAELKIEQGASEELHKIKFYQKDNIIEAYIDSEEVFITKCFQKKEEAQLDLPFRNLDQKDVSYRKIKKNVLRYNSMKKELYNFEENINQNLSPIVGLNECFTTSKIIANLERILEKKCVY